MTSKTTTQSSTKDVLEFIAHKPERVDTETGVIHGVKIIGNESGNGRTYPPAVLEAARPLYEGAKVNVDHPDRNTPDRDRRADERFGKLENVVANRDGLYGDLRYLKSHPLAPMVVESAERMPDLFGLSHNATIRETMRDGGAIVEAITHVRSVDLVADPATTNSIFESNRRDESKETDMAKTIKTTVRKIMEARKAVSAKGCKRVLEMMDEPLVDGGSDPYGDIAVEVPEETPVEEQVEAAFEAMVLAVLQDETLDTAGKKKKIGDILAAQEKLMASDDTPVEAETSTTEESDDPAEDDPKSADETESLKAKVVRLERREKARVALESAGVQATSARITAAASVLESKAELTALTSDWKTVDEAKAKTTTGDGSGNGGANKAKPRSGSTLESQRNEAGGDSDKPLDLASFSASLMGRRF